MMKWFKKINKQHKDWYKNNKYYFSKHLVWGFFAVAIILLLVVAYIDGFEDKIYVTCDEYSLMGCRNPLVLLGEGECDHYCCTIDFLPPGFVCGEEISWLGANYSWLVLLLFIITLLINHFVYNRGYDFNKYWGKYK